MKRILKAAARVISLARRRWRVDRNIGVIVGMPAAFLDGLKIYLPRS